jgi:hypothetical protein
MSSRVVPKRVAVVGGGIFGSTAAIHAARAGHEVHLFEEKSALLQAASGINQYRLHRGYHYPRSSETASSARNAERSFREEYGDSVISGGRNIYAIAREDTFVDASAFLDFCRVHDLVYNELPIDQYCDPANVDLVVEVEESWMDPDALRAQVAARLRESGVEMHMAIRATTDILESFDAVIVATYAQLNAVMPHQEAYQEYQFEVCEKPVVRLSDLQNTGIVVMDGPFMCADPLGKTGFHVLGNVVHAIHATNTGVVPQVPENIAPLLNSGLIEKPLVTNIDAFIRHGSRFIPALRDAEHVGSFFTIRTVLPRMEKTDARPTVVTRISDRYIRIFSGKIGNCVEAAKEAVLLI